jgi:predicted nucleic acid-binding protein
VESLFRLAPDTPDIYPTWRQIVASVGVSGVQVHDARLAAVMRVHGLSHILTLNPTDFARYPGVTVVHPQDLASTPPPQAGPASP